MNEDLVKALRALADELSTLNGMEKWAIEFRPLLYGASNSIFFGFSGHFSPESIKVVDHITDALKPQVGDMIDAALTEQRRIVRERLRAAIDLGLAHVGRTVTK